jgi:hypothetical protein
MKLNKIAATAAMAAGLGSAALGIGAGLAQADPGGGHGPGGPNVPGPNVPGQGHEPGPGWVPGQPICNGGPGVNCNGPGTPLPPGQRGFPPPGHYNDPVGYGLPPVWHHPQGFDGDYPIVFNPEFGQWGVFVNGQFIAYAG